MSLCNTTSTMCMNMIDDFEENTETICCPGDTCPGDTAPEECSHECAALVVPFMKRCGTDFASMLGPEDGDSLMAFDRRCVTEIRGGH